MIIGKKGSDIEKLKKDISKTTSGNVSINIVEIKKPELDSQLVADNIAQQLERRVAFRRAMKRAVQSAMRLGALGIRVNCSGRLGGAEIARPNGIEKVEFLFTHFVLTLIMEFQELIQHMEFVALKFGFLKVKNLIKTLITLKITKFLMMN